MAQVKNRGKFGHKVGRPSKKMIAELTRRKEISGDPYNALHQMAREDVRMVDPEDVADYEDTNPGNGLEVEEWVWEFLSRGENPFLFKSDGLIVQMGGLNL